MNYRSTLLIVVCIFGGCLRDDSKLDLVAYSPHGEHVSRENFPVFIQELEKLAEDSDITTTSLKVQRVAHDEFFFRSDDSEGMFQLVCSHWQLLPLASNGPSARNFQLRIKQTDLLDGEYFANSNVLEGEKGARIIVMRSSSNRLLIGHYYYNF